MAECTGERTGEGPVAGEEYEAALRSLPEAHSLAIRLRDAGVADEVICGYLRIDDDCLDTFIDLARRKLNSAIADRRQ